jgi:hypothetical protein
MSAALIAALAPLIAALAPLLAQWMLRRWAAADDPRNQFQEEKDENAKVVIQSDATDLNVLLDERLNRVRPPAGGAVGGQSGGEAAGGQELHPGQ